MKVYLDNCCYNRYTDDRSILKNRRQLTAIKEVVSRIEQGRYELITSDFTIDEIQKTNDAFKKSVAKRLIQLSSKQVELSENIERLARQLTSFKIKSFDALHLACAQYHADAFFTVDDGFFHKAVKVKKENKIPILTVKIYKPDEWYFYE